MMMRKPLRGAALIGATTALVVGLSMGTALAATRTWTVKPGGTVAAKAGKTTLTDKANGFKLSCSSSTATAKLKKGRKLSGKGIGKIAKINFNGCSVLTQKLVVKSSHLPWTLNAVSYKKGVTTGTITGIHATISVPSLSCSMVVDGTGAAKNNGMVKVTYSNKTHVLKILPGGDNLHIYKVSSGCPTGIVNNGDASSFAGSYKLKKAEKITSP